MKKTNIIKYFTGIMLAFVMSILPVVASQPAHAQSAAPVKCGKDEIAVSIAINGKNCIPKGSGQTVNSNPIFLWMVNILRFLAVGVGIAAVGGVVYGGFLYLTARGNSGQVQKGVMAIINSAIGILLYGLMYAIINFLVPGGILR